MHTVPFETPLGFHERYVVENKDRFLDGRYYFDEWDKALAARGLVKQQRELYRQRPDYREAMGAFTWDLPADMHSDNFVGGLARWWLDTYPTTRPLFLEVGFPGPHPPYDPTPEALAPYLDRDLPIRPVSQADLDGQPEALRVMREHNTEVDHDSVIHIVDAPLESRHRQRAHYLANVTMIDTQVGELMDALERNGYADDCVVIFTSDHGDCLGDHGHIQKWTMYDTITRVPCIVWSPNRFAGGRRIDDLVQWFDLGPTILELAGCESDPSMEARSLLPALEGRQAPQREYVFTEQGRDDGNGLHVDLVTAVRSQTWKLVHFLGEDEGQLFDLGTIRTKNTTSGTTPQPRPCATSWMSRDWRVQQSHRQLGCKRRPTLLGEDEGRNSSTRARMNRPRRSRSSTDSKSSANRTWPWSRTTWPNRSRHLGQSHALVLWSERRDGQCCPPLESGIRRRACATERPQAGACRTQTPRARDCISASRVKLRP